jgi:hypothetical protein
MSLRPKLPPKRDRSAEFTTFVPKPRAPAEVSPQLRAALDGTVASLFLPRPPAPKVQGRKRQDIRDSARGEECTIRLPGCDGGGETTVSSAHSGADRAMTLSTGARRALAA